MAVEGIGPKTARVLFKRLGVKSLDDLERAAKEHKIREIKRLGPKTEENILSSIELAKTRKLRTLLGRRSQLPKKSANSLGQTRWRRQVR